MIILALVAAEAQPNYNQGILLQTVQPHDYVPGQAIVGFYGPTSFLQEVPWILANQYSLKVSDTNYELCAVLYSNVDDETFSLLQGDENVKYVQRNYIGELAIIPNDPDWSLHQWGPQRIDAPDAWDITTGSSEVIVAVIDTGIDYNHLDLNDNYLSGGYDWVNHDSDPMDDNGHGTHCAGIIGAEGNNGEGIAGMNWHIKLLAEKVIKANGNGTQWDFGKGVVHAVNNGADIISISLGWFDDPDGFLRQAIQFAYNQNRLCIACSHNDSSNIIRFPARYPEVIAVGATDQSDSRCSWSNYGPDLDIVAPGDNIYSTLPNNSYGNLSGTSMACPHVAGVAALMLSTNPDLTIEEIRCILQTTAEDLGTAGWDDEYGHGLVNAYDAVLASNFRYSIEVTPSSDVITVPGSVAFAVTVTLIQGMPQNVNLDLDTYYPPAPYTSSFSQNSGLPPFTSTLTIGASSPQLPKILRVVGSSDTVGCPIIRHSNFFTVSTEEPIGDLVWIKTSPQDNGTVNPRLGDVWKSPWIQSDPDPPQIGNTNKLCITVGNIDPNVDSGPVLVKPYFNEYPFTIPIKDFPSLEAKTIDNIPAGQSVEVCWDNWELPSGWPKHFCVFVQAWRPGYEDFDESFDIQGNNNIAQKNFAGVYSSSPYKTVFTFENPTDKPMEITVYMQTPGPGWTVDLCIPSDYEEGYVVTPLLVPPKQQRDLQLTIDLGREEEGEVDIWYRIKGYEKIYPDLMKFTFYVKSCGCKIDTDGEEKPLTGIYSTFNLYYDVVEMYVRVVKEDYSNLIYNIEICREDQQPMWDSIDVLETPPGWSFEDLGCGVRFYTETDPLIKCQRVRFVFRVTAERISWYMRIHVTDKDHQNVGMIVGTRWWLYHYPV